MIKMNKRIWILQTFSSTLKRILAKISLINQKILSPLESIFITESNDIKFIKIGSGFDDKMNRKLNEQNTNRQIWPDLYCKFFSFNFMFL